MNFLQLLFTPPDDNLLYVGHYDLLLVSVSVSLAIIASYVAFVVTQSTDFKGGVDHFLEIVGGLCMGIGIWSMHFIGMIAFTLPCNTSYDPYITALSMVPGILASALALRISNRDTIAPLQLLVSGVLLGAGIGAMHYTGMAAMRIEGLIRYNIWFFLLSVVVAVIMAVLALWIKFRIQGLSQRSPTAGRALVIGSIVMGLAVSVMHYTAMMATYFVRDNSDAAAGWLNVPEAVASIVHTLQAF